MTRGISFALATASVYAAAAAAVELPEGAILSIDRNLVYNTLIQLFNVALLTTVLTLLLYKPVRKFLADRKKRIQGEIEGARRHTDDALALKAKYERLIAEIEAEREEILRQTQKNAVEKSDQLLFEARREAEVIFQRAKAELDLERESVSEEIKRQIIEIAYVMASRFIQVSIDRETQDRLIAQALDEWDSAEGEGVAGPSHSGRAGRFAKGGQASANGRPAGAGSGGTSRGGAGSGGGAGGRGTSGGGAGRGGGAAGGAGGRGTSGGGAGSGGGAADA